MKIEIWSDFVCPFCYIGKRKLELALEKVSFRENVFIQFKSFQLDPHAELTPKDTYYELLSKRLNTSIDKIMTMTKNLANQASDIGLTFNFSTMQSTNTFDAHRLAHYAKKHGKDNEVIEQLFKAHFTDSRHIGDRETLVKLAKGNNLDDGEVLASLEAAKMSRSVREDQDVAKEIGIQGVPFFIFNERYTVSGAQSIDSFVSILENVWEEEINEPKLKQAFSKKAETSYCAGENCKES